jgi:hypothetical protein
VTSARASMGRCARSGRKSARLHLDPTHTILAVMEALNQDVVQDFLIASRIGQIQSMQLYRGTDLMALFAQVDSSMPALY